MERIKSFFKINSNIIKQIVISLGCIIIFVVGVFIGIQYDRLETKLKKPEVSVKKFSNPIKLETMSVALTDNGELIMINRSTGEYDVYSEEVGDAIFQSVGNRITK